jgi:lipopolysaccharide export system protein LptC
MGLALLALAGLFGWSAWQHRSAHPPPVATGLRPDYLMHDFEIISLNEEGNESMALRAPLMERNATNQTMNITTPLFLLPDADGNAWQLRAKTGWVNADGDELRLRGDVVGDSPQGIDTPTRLQTTHLNVFPRRNLAVTDAKVTLTQPGVILTGVGFEVDTQTRRYVLKSQVQSRYVPKSAR